MIVTVHLWGVPGSAVPRAVWHMAADRGRLRPTPGLRFAKLLGTGTGRTFTPLDADPRRLKRIRIRRPTPIERVGEEGQFDGRSQHG